MSSSPTILRFVDDKDDVRRCFPTMVQLRPHLTGEDEFVARWHRQVIDGYRLLAVFDDQRVLALAGYRVQENLVYGRFLYVDDLVTDAAVRSGGHGEQLMTRLKQEARSLNCVKLVLDTPLANSLGQRFYFRNGLLTSAVRFNTPV
jgi:GNAT superfamily N-acetyltransferase